MVVVLIPAYKPDMELIKLVDKLSEEKLSILVVDDGSGKEYDDVFDAISDKADVIHASSNGGKGSALKMGIRTIRERYKDCLGFVTADADGQHKVEDIVRIAKLLEKGSSIVVSIRIMTGKIPARSLFGNVLSRWIYTLLTGHHLLDNQSGLRGFSVRHIDWLLDVAGDKYDYEMNVLYYADKQRIVMDTIPIEAIYIDGNKSSHFSPVKDTLRIYKQLFTSARASLMATGICGVFALVVSFLLDYKMCMVTVPVMGYISGFLCVLVNRYIFRKIPYRDAGRSLLDLAVRFTVYTEWCFFASRLIPGIPFAVAFFLIVFLLEPLRYYIYKLIGFTRLQK